jgi:DNA repair photolyase
MPDDFEYRDALLHASARGRGAQLNPGNRHESLRLHVLGEHLDQVITEQGDDGQQVRTEVFADRTKTIINHVASPDIGFNWSINPYRGCEHGCIYCYARPDHERLGFSCGLDFETKIVAKFDAPKLLRQELAHPRWKGETIAMSGVTDCYQPIEEKLRITRGCLQVMAECRQPVSIVTKSRLILRDLDLLTTLAADRAASVAVSITTLDPSLSRRMEPRASSPAQRLKTIETLAAAGIPVSVMTAPIIAGLNDREVPSILEAASRAGARSAGWVMLRLPHQIKALFLDWLQREFPDRATHVESLIRQMRGGDLYDATWRTRQRGEGPMAEQIARVFKIFSKRYGLDRPWPGLSSKSFRPPPLQGQMPLF